MITLLRLTASAFGGVADLLDRLLRWRSSPRGDALQPTVDALQQSAIDLFGQLINPAVPA